MHAVGVKEKISMFHKKQNLSNNHFSKTTIDICVKLLSSKWIKKIERGGK
jgi:hypothetical protein